LACGALVACGARTGLSTASSADDGYDAAIDARDDDAVADAAIDVREAGVVVDSGVQTTTTLVVQVPGTANLSRSSNPAAGDSPPVLGSGPPVCPGTRVQVTATGCVVSDGPTCVGPDGNNGGPFNGLPVYTLIGQWGRSPNGLTAATAVGNPFFVGSSIVLVAPSAPGSYFLYLAENDGIFSDNSRAYSVTVTYTQAAMCR
jgi:hypothetical protein